LNILIRVPWDVFISHASEDKEEVARPLAALLREAGLEVWLDENELTLGDSLSRKIDHGLAQSRYGAVILSKHFFNKAWPPLELSGLVAKQVDGEKVILPVWHGIDREFVLRYSPTLADTLAVNTNEGLDAVAKKIVEAVRTNTSAPPSPKPGSSIRWAAMKWWLLLGCVVLAFGSIALFLPTLQRFLHPEPAARSSQMWLRITNTAEVKFDVSKQVIVPTGRVLGVVSDRRAHVFLLYRLARECYPPSGSGNSPAKGVAAPRGCDDPANKGGLYV
jgi:hypothetical protein